MNLPTLVFLTAQFLSLTCGEIIESCVDEERDCAWSSKSICQYNNEYRGTKKETLKGEPCLPWAKSKYYPHEDGNYCRNPGPGVGFAPWCYIEGSEYGRYCFKDCSSLPDTKVSPNQPRVTKADIRAAVDAHNECRWGTDAVPKLQPLTWDKNLSDFAQKFSANFAAKHCGSGVLEHSPQPSRENWPGWPGGFGENGSWRTTPIRNASNYFKDSVRSWCNEKRDYDIVTNTKIGPGKIGHYRMVVAQDATHVGCGLTICKPFTIASKPGVTYVNYGYIYCEYGSTYTGNWPTAPASRYRPYYRGTTFNCRDFPDKDCEMVKRKGGCKYLDYAIDKCPQSCDACSRLGDAAGK